MLSRRHVLAGAAAVAAAPLLLPGRAVAAEGTDWGEWLAKHRDNVKVFADDGRDGRIAHQECRMSPMASAYKAIHAAAFAGSGINPQRQIKIRDWESYYLPGTDGNAHPNSLAMLGIPANGAWAADPDQLVPLDWVVRAMIIQSDNSAADYLHDLLGVPALRRTAARGGWPEAQVPALIGQVLRLWWPGTNDELARRFLTDTEFHAAALAKLSQPPIVDPFAWAKTTHRASAVDLASLHRSIATERIPGRRYLELALAPLVQPGELGIGYKGGELPGILTLAFSLRRADGTIGISVVLVSDLTADDYKALHANEGDFAMFCLGMLRDPAVLARVGKALGHA
ncbi:serine hydrolase [Kutzneria sp. CA-103260]|uniref:serine hydrolase n=1 Tax=Kutzneria sp. CA-103260 TaxID=2802641 RepID=UPI001BA6DD8C|nr:serine hydrolase [Kutzneria sp. CA-103260]QUQ67814.1 Beta-lactamase enzyme family protein [Kutzneria sp. CA-103260]